MGHMDLRENCVRSNPILNAAAIEIANCIILGQREYDWALDEAIEGLIALRDRLEGDLDLEDGDVDCCSADDDHTYDVTPWGAFWLATAGDPNDAEHDDPDEDGDPEETCFPEEDRSPLGGYDAKGVWGPPAPTTAAEERQAALLAGSGMSVLYWQPEPT